MVKFIKTINPESFMYAVKKAYDFTPEEEKELEEKFFEKYQDRFQSWFDAFVLGEVMTRAAGMYPVLNTRIEDTPLSNRAKKALLGMDVNTVARLYQYSPAELSHIRNMGAGTVKEICDYIAGLGIDQK